MLNFFAGDAHYLKFKRNLFLYGIYFILFGLLCIFILYPILSVFKLSLMPDDKFGVDVYVNIVRHSRYVKAIFNSMILGVTVASIATVIAYLFAFSLTKTNIKWKKAFKMLVFLPIIAPPFMFGISIILLFGHSGLITSGIFNIDDYDIYGFDGLVITKSFALFPLAYLVLTGILNGIDPDLEAGAMNLGAPKFKAFTTVTLPLSLPGIFAAWLLVFVATITDFGTPILLGGNFDVLSVLAYLEFTGMGNLPRGAALAVILLVPTLLVFMLQKHLLKNKTFTTITGKSSRGSITLTTPFVERMFFGFNLLICLFMGLMYMVIISCMFIKIWGVNWSFTLEHFEYAWDVSLGALINTLILAGIATPITAIFGMVIAYLTVKKKLPGGKAVSMLSMLMYAIPGTAVGIGYILAFNEPPLLLTGTAAIIVACFVFRTMPIGVEAGSAALRQISDDIEEASTNLGASDTYTFKKIILPLISPAFFTSASYTFLRSMTSLSAVIFVVSGRWNLLTPLLLSQTEQLRLSAASITSMMLVVSLIIGVFLLNKLTAYGNKKVFTSA